MFFKANITYCYSTSLLSNMQVWLKHLVCLKHSILHVVWFGVWCVKWFGVKYNMGCKKNIYIYLKINVCIYSYVYMYLYMYIYTICKYMYIYKHACMMHVAVLVQTSCSS